MSRKRRTASKKAVQKQKRQDREQRGLNSEQERKDIEQTRLYRSRRGRTADRRGWMASSKRDWNASVYCVQ